MLNLDPSQQIRVKRIAVISGIVVVLAIALMAGLSTPPTHAAPGVLPTYAVDTPSDDVALNACTPLTPGDCSLRGAVQKANLNGGATITFTAGIVTINLGSSLILTGGLITIRGNSFLGPIITAPASAPAFIFASDSNVIQFLIITSSNPGSAAQDGVRVDSGSNNTIGVNNLYNLGGSGIHVQGGRQAQLLSNSVGARYLVGTTYADCAHGNQRYGILLTSPNNLLDANTVGCNHLGGVAISGTAATTNTVTNNRIGLSLGNQLLPNEAGGVLLLNGAHANQIGRAGSYTNTISGNHGAGIDIAGSATLNNTVAHNYIGLNVTGTAAISNTTYGVLIEQSAAANVVGGKFLTDSNYIAGNAWSGIGIIGIIQNNISDTHFNTIKGNVVGLNIHGQAVPNGQDGIHVSSGAYANFIGSFDKAERNVIAGNAGNGVRISFANYNDVYGNTIGTDLTGVYANGNQLDGVLIDGSSAQSNYVGALAFFGVSYAANIIGGNTGNGVHITTGAHDTSVVANKIGINVSYTLLLPNGGNGILVDVGAHDNTIGGDFSSGSTNDVLGSGLSGVVISGSTTTGNKVLANTLHQNTLAGLLVAAGAHGNTIGSGGSFNQEVASYINTTGVEVASGAHDNSFTGMETYFNGILGNIGAQDNPSGILITGAGTTHNVFSATTSYQNSGDGLSQSSSASGNTWSHVSIYRNAGLGIDTNADNPAGNIVNTPYPIITSIAVNGPDVTVYGKASPSLGGVNSVQVELYRVYPNGSGFGEGQTFVGSNTTSNTGDWSITFTGASGCFTAFQTSTNLMGGVSNSYEFGPNSCRVFLPITLKNS